MAKTNSEATQSAPVAEGRVRIVIHNANGQGGDSDVFCTDATGKPFLIKRECEVDVPHSVLDGLRNAIIEEAVTDSEGAVVNTRAHRRFNLTVLGRG